MAVEKARWEGDRLILTGRKRVATAVRLAPTSPEAVLGPLTYHHHEVRYEVSIDAKDLEQMADVAFRNKGRKAKDGPVSVRITASGSLSVEGLEIKSQ